ncbi:Trm112 family protein [Pseudomonadota bacterium]
MPIDGKMLEILCCPVSKTPLTRLSAGRLKALNEAISAGQVQYVRGEQVDQPLREALITEDSKVIYPVVDEIPILLEEKGIGTTQLQDF